MEMSQVMSSLTVQDVIKKLISVSVTSFWTIATTPISNKITSKFSKISEIKLAYFTIFTILGLWLK
jgi:hypothetical protein